MENGGKRRWDDMDSILNNEGRDTCDMIRLFNISSFPTKVLIDPNGIVIARIVGGMADAGEVLEKMVD